MLLWMIFSALYSLSNLINFEEELDVSVNHKQFLSIMLFYFNPCNILRFVMTV